MKESSVLQITSSSNSGIGTGFVIDSDEKGVVVATCSHVIASCTAESLLVEGLVAVLRDDYKSAGLDLAILYVEGLVRDPFKVAENQPEKVKLFGYTYFNTKIRNNIKGEVMNKLDAKYDVSLSGEGQTIKIIRLSSQHKISSGYSGSPVICEQSGVVVGMVALEVSGNSSESYTNYAISAKHILENYDFPKQKERKSNSRSFIADNLFFIQ